MTSVLALILTSYVVDCYARAATMPLTEFEAFTCWASLELRVVARIVGGDVHMREFAVWMPINHVSYDWQDPLDVCMEYSGAQCVPGPPSICPERRPMLLWQST